VVERRRTESGPSLSGVQAEEITIDSTDYGFIQEVVDGSLKILQTAITLAENNVLLYSPVRTFLSITTASIFLLKGLSLGVGATKLRTSLDTVTGVISALRSSALDDIHLGSRYAILLELHVARLKESFVPSRRPPNFATRPPSMEHRQASDMDEENALPSAGGMASMMELDGQTDQVEDWLTLPFDPSLVPFVPGDTHGFSWLGDGTLDFIWNLEV